MKTNKGIKIALVIVIACIALGLLSIMAAFMTGTFNIEKMGWLYSDGNVGKQVNETVIESQGVDVLVVDHMDASIDVVILTTKEKDIRIKEVLRKGDKFANIKKRDSGDLEIKASRRKPRIFSWELASDYTEIYLPEDYKGKIEIKASSADITMKDQLELSDIVKISTTSGEIFTRDLKAEGMEISVSSGDITLKNVDAEKKISTTSGEVFVEDSVGNADISVSSGDITLDNNKGNFDIKATSGEIYIEALEGSGNISTSSGDITAKIRKVTGNMDVEATSGEVYLSLPSKPGFSLEANATSGDITTFFDENVKYNKRGNEAEGTIGTAATRVTINTSSGDITIDEY